jgi:hypothetical protein
MKPRVKFHSMPGDISKQEKISMLEGKHPDKKRSKSFKKEVRMKEKAVERERCLYCGGRHYSAVCQQKD